MSAQLIEIRAEGHDIAMGRTVVYVEGKLAYSTGNPTSIEAHNLERVFEILVIENVEIRITEAK